MAEKTVITLRLPRSIVERADALVERAEDEDVRLVWRSTRSYVLRLALQRGLEALELQSRRSGGRNR